MSDVKLNACSAINTDRELWRERDGDFYADSIHVTKTGEIGISVAGHVIIKPVREWHKLAKQIVATEPQPMSREDMKQRVAQVKKCLDEMG